MWPLHVWLMGEPEQKSLRTIAVNHQLPISWNARREQLRRRTCWLPIGGSAGALPQTESGDFQRPTKTTKNHPYATLSHRAISLSGPATCSSKPYPNLPFIVALRITRILDASNYPI